VQSREPGGVLPVVQGRRRAVQEPGGGARTMEPGGSWSREPGGAWCRGGGARHWGSGARRAWSLAAAVPDGTGAAARAEHGAWRRRCPTAAAHGFGEEGKIENKNNRVELGRARTFL
jgi:hypothetical protein